MEIFAACGDGFGDIAAGELLELGFSCGKIQPGRVEISDAGPVDIVRLNFLTRTVSRVFIRLSSAEVQSLEGIRDHCSAVDFSRWFDAGQSFAIRGKREGKHDFTSMDMARDVGSSVVEHFQKTSGKRIPVNLDNPEIEIYAILKGSTFELLLNTSGRPLEYRYRRPFQHFAPIKPVIAASLLRLSSCFDRGNLLDPMAGGGTIAIEAVLRSLNIAPGVYRKFGDYLFSNLHFIEPAIWENELEAAKSRIADTSLINVLASDRFRKNVDGMVRNLNHFGISTHVTVTQGLAETMSYIENGQFDCIVTNPPYGMRIGSIKQTEQLYRNFAKACALREIREVIALTPLKKTWIRSFMENGYAISHSRIAQFGNLHVNIIKATIQ